MKNYLLKNSIALTVIIFMVGVGCAWAEEVEFKVNPNKLPLCPPAIDVELDIGPLGSIFQCKDCWGRYQIKYKKNTKGDVLEGEWKNGLLNGIGTYYFLADNERKGNRYVGEWKEGLFNGRGILNYIDGKEEQGIWESGKFIRETKVNLIGLSSKSASSSQQDNNQLELKSFENSLNQFRVGNFTAAALGFEEFIKRYPQSSNLPNAYYWLGSSNYILKDYKKALPAFEIVISRFVDSSIAPEAMLVKASCQLEMGNITLAVQSLDSLIIKYPKSSQAKIGKERLAILKNKYQNSKNNDSENERQQLVEERKKFEEEKLNREIARNNQRINLQVTNTEVNVEGDFVINIQTGTDTASLKINGEEQGGKQDGSYAIKRVARAGQATQFTILAKDVYGNTDSKTISVTRQVAISNSVKYAELNPALIKTQPSKDAVAIIIGIQNYKRVPKAEFANNDAQAFYDYAVRALGVKPENIKLLVDEQADEVEILSAFQNWLPIKVRKQKTDVYVYYSGHGLPSDDGNSLYILPHGADKQFIAKTAINQQEVIAALQAVQPKSVSMFMDACYSGQIRTGENLIASARPISIKANAQVFPPEFTVITASQSDQIASSSADFKHGIFSYYLMKGMEGDADENKDNKITAGELQSYLQDMVGRKAMSVNRKQVPQLAGDANKVLVGK